MNKPSNRYIDGRKNDPLYFVFYAMFARCNIPTNKDYKDYGARGITVCTEWETFEEFRAWSLANGYKVGLTLDRDDNSKGYSLDNCKWVSRTHQANNRRVRKGTDPDMIGIKFRDESWQATYSIFGRGKHIGCFPTVELAKAARNLALQNKKVTYERLQL